MRKISKSINEKLRKKVLNHWYGVYIRCKPKYDNTTFERFLQLNLFYNPPVIKKYKNARTNKNSH